MQFQPKTHVISYVFQPKNTKISRIINHFLQQWKQDSLRKPLLIRGARQVGKTYSVRKLGALYKDFVKINFELQTNAHKIFEKDLDPIRILRELSLIAKKPITPDSTLLLSFIFVVILIGTIDWLN